jgi:DNA-binding transcriptional LysR family regulator
LLEEASRIKGNLTGRLRLGACSSLSNEAVGHLLTTLTQRYPDVEVTFKHGTSVEIAANLRNGSLDAGYYNEAAEPDTELSTLEVSQFKVYLSASPGLVSPPLDWKAIADIPWIYPTSSACCAQAAESLFRLHQIRPKRVISVDRESLTQTLVASGMGVGLLHEGSARAAEARGEVTLLSAAPKSVRVLFAHLKNRTEDPLLGALKQIIEGKPDA